MRRVVARVRSESGRVRCRQEDRAMKAGASRQSSCQDVDRGASRRFGDVREDVVTTVLNKEEGGK